MQLALATIESSDVTAMPVDDAAAAPRRAYWPLIDAGRMLAVVGVVLIHSLGSDSLEPVKDASRFAVPFFAAAAIFLMAQAIWRQNPSFPSFLTQRFRRLYVPFFFWTAFYFALRLLKSRAFGTAPPVFGWTLLTAGSTYHLWFLPALFWSSLAAFPLFLATRGDGRADWIAILATVAIGVAFCIPVKALHQADLTRPSLATLICFTWEMMPAICWGAAVAIIVRRLPALPANATTTLVAACIWIACCARLALRGRSIWIENLAGVALVVAALMAVPAFGPAMRTILSSAFGIYLCHVFFLEAYQAAAHAAHVAPTVRNDLIVATTVFFSSLVLAVLLGRSRVTARLVT